jgi:hypothetical protein
LSARRERALCWTIAITYDRPKSDSDGDMMTAHDDEKKKTTNWVAVMLMVVAVCVIHR